jgi:hypothetical protein
VWRAGRGCVGAELCGQNCDGAIEGPIIVDRCARGERKGPEGEGDEV